MYMCLVAFSMLRYYVAYRRVWTLGTSVLHMLHSRMFTQHGACVCINAALVFSSDSSESRELPQSACVASLCCFVRIAPASHPTPIAASRRSYNSTTHLYCGDVHKLFLTATTSVVLSCLRLRQVQSIAAV